MFNKTCKECGKEKTKQIPIPCPDNKRGCCVYHFKLVCEDCYKGDV